MRGELGATGNKSYVELFSAIAIFVLIIACLNYVNLSTSRSIQRWKEIGVRKVLGAARKNLIKQFIFESLVMVTISMMISLLLFELLFPLLREFLDLDFVIDYLREADFYSGDCDAVRRDHVEMALRKRDYRF